MFQPSVGSDQVMRPKLRSMTAYPFYVNMGNCKLLLVIVSICEQLSESDMEGLYQYSSFAKLQCIDPFTAYQIKGKTNSK